MDAMAFTLQRVVWSKTVHLVHPWHPWTVCGRDIPMNQIRYVEEDAPEPICKMCEAKLS